MTFSEPFMLLPNSAFGAFTYSIRAVNAVNQYSWEPAHCRVRQADSPCSFRKQQSCQHLQAVAPAQTAGRRVGAGAGATPVSVAAIRHDTFLARRVSLVGHSRTCPSSPIANPNTIRSQNEVISNELVSKE